MRSIAAGFAFSSLILGRILYSEDDFGVFAYVVQCITILVVFGQSGLEFLIFKSASRNQLRLLPQFAYLLLFASPFVCLLTLILVQTITGTWLELMLALPVMVSAFSIILLRSVANEDLGLGRIMRYQILDQGVRWAPISLVTLTLLGLWFFSGNKISVQVLFAISAFGYVVLCLAVIRASNLFRLRGVGGSRPRMKLASRQFLRGLRLNAPNALLFLVGVLDQLLLIRILEISDYGVYRIAALSLAVLAILVDVLGLGIRRDFMAERDTKKRSVLFFALRGRYRLLGLAALCLSAALMFLAPLTPFNDYIFLASLLLIGQAVSLFLGDPMFALKVDGKEGAAVGVVLAIIAISFPLNWMMIASFGMTGAAIGNGMTVVMMKCALYVVARRTRAVWLSNE